MTLGPVDLLVVKFPGNQFRGEIVPALEELIDSSTIRIVDLIFVTKEENGAVAALEYSDLNGDTFALLSPLVQDTAGLLNQEDVAQIAALLDPNSSAALMLFENVWATRFRDAVLDAQGQILLTERVPRTVVQEVLDYQNAA
jgi:hypothetical protein